MFPCPITYYKRNLIFNNDSSCWAVFKLRGSDYDFASFREKLNILFRTTRLLANVMSEAQVLILPKGQELTNHFNRLKNGLDKNDSLFASAISQADATEAYLKEKIRINGAANEYATYIVVKLAKSDEIEAIEGFKEHWRYFIQEPINALNVIFNLDTKDILLNRLERCKKLANKWLTEQNQRFEMQEIETEETQWLIRRMQYRGLNKKVPLFYKNKSSAWEPEEEQKIIGKKTIIKQSKDIVNLFSGTITTGNRYLKIEHEEETSYQSFLVLTNIPDEIDYPDHEWIYQLQKQDFKSEVCINFKIIEHRESLRKIDLKKRELNSQIGNVDEVNADMPQDLLEGKEYASILEDELKSAKLPILKTSVVICCAADNLDTLEKDVSDTMNLYQDMNFGIERPISDQFKLFMQCIPSSRTICKDYILSITPTMLASGVIGADVQLGDNVGPYIGTTGLHEKKVYLSLGLACLNNMSASATFYGNLGVGKSFNANLLLYLTILYEGGYGLIIDPKGERSHWAEELDVFKGLINTVSLSSSEEDRGKLDPYNIFPDNIDMANELALNVLSELFKLAPTSDEYTVLLEGAKRIKDTCKNIRPSMERFIRILDEFDSSDDLYSVAKKVARNIRLRKENGMSGLLFGDGTEEAITLDNRLNILQIQNLKLPSVDTKKEDYTSEEMLSSILMMVISQFAKKFAMVKRNVFSIILFDESWMLGSTAEGIKLYEFLTRMGRSLYFGCIFNGHSVKDIPTEAIKNTITYKFCFKTNNENEAERMVEYLGLENSKENRNKIMNLGNGECVFKDLYGNIGKLKFDAVFDDIINVFNTTPKAKEPEEEPEELELVPEEQEPGEEPRELELVSEEQEPGEEPEELELVSEEQELGEESKELELVSEEQEPGEESKELELVSEEQEPGEEPEETDTFQKWSAEIDNIDIFAEEKI